MVLSNVVFYDSVISCVIYLGLVQISWMYLDMSNGMRNEGTETFLRSTCSLQVSYVCKLLLCSLICSQWVLEYVSAEQVLGINLVS